MIKLFKSTDTDFISSNGLGAISDAISGKVIEKRNGSFELELKYPVSGKRFPDLCLRQIIVSKSNPFSNPQAFRIYNITKPINGVITINAEHISYDANGIAVSPFLHEATSGGETINASIYDVATNPADAMVLLNKHIINDSGKFTLNTIGMENSSGEMTLKLPSTLRSVLGGTDGSVLDSFSGEYEFNNYNITLYKNRGIDRGVTLRYGKNLEDITQEENCASMYTHIYPYYYGYDENDVPIITELESKIMKINEDAEYDHIKVFLLDLSNEFDEKPTTDDLVTKAKAYIKYVKMDQPKVSITLSMTDTSKYLDDNVIKGLQTVMLCDTVHVFFPKLEITADSKCIATTYDILNDKYISIELGDARSSLGDTVAGTDFEIKKATDKVESDMTDTINKVSALITGGLGGYVVMHSSTGDQKYPDEILILCEFPDWQMKQKIWRWNKNGLGFSKNGYEGPFITAITANGEMVADLIKTGTLDGSIIKAGSIAAEAISQAYKKQVTDEITGAKTELNEEISARYGELNAKFTSLYTGGINILRNSSGSNGVSDDWVTSGTGRVSSEQDTEECLGYTLSGSCFIINNDSITQGVLLNISDVYADDGVTKIKPLYTITFKVKSTSTLTCSAKMIDLVNDVEETTVMFEQNGAISWSEVSYTFTPRSSKVYFKFECNSGDFKVADIMLSKGSTKQQWTPAPNEIYTTNVKIDRHGINITNSMSSTETCIDHEQFQIKYKKVSVLSVDKDETYMHKAKVDSLTVSKGRWTEATDGIDFTILD